MRYRRGQVFETRGWQVTEENTGKPTRQVGKRVPVVKEKRRLSMKRAEPVESIGKADYFGSRSFPLSACRFSTF